MTAPGRRAEVIAGLRELAQFLQDHPGLPVPKGYGPEGIGISVGIDIGDKDDDQGCRAIVGLAATEMGVTPAWESGHYQVQRKFSGGISYRVLYIPRQVMARHAAEQSYVPNIRVAS